MQNGLHHSERYIWQLTKLYRYFNRDVDCIRTFFKRRFQYESSLYPKFSRAVSEGSDSDSFRLDVVVEASGFGRKDMKFLEEVYRNCLVYLT